MLIGKEHNFLLIPVNTLILFSMKKVVKMVKYPSRKKKKTVVKRVKYTVDSNLTNSNF